MQKSQNTHVFSEHQYHITRNRRSFNYEDEFIIAENNSMDLQNPFCKLKIISLIKPKTPNKQSRILLFNLVEHSEETPEQQMSIKITSFCINLKKKKINKTISKNTKSQK
jgi:hypothetical protein